MTSNNIKTICDRLGDNLSFINKDYNTLLSMLEDTDEDKNLEIQDFAKSLKFLQNAFSSKNEDPDSLKECFKKNQLSNVMQIGIEEFFQ
jgi:hypothetical protein